MKKVLLIIIIFLVFIPFILVRAASAQHNEGIDMEAITVFPVIYEVHATRGESKEIEASIANNTGSKIFIEISFHNINLESLVEDDRLVIKEDGMSKEPAMWISSNNTSFEIEANVTKSIQFDLTIPEDAEIKSYYPVIIYKTRFTGHDKLLVEISDQISSLIYLNIAEVKGEVAKSSARITTFEVNKRVVLYPNASFNLNFENTGGTFIHPRGKIHIYDRNGMHLSETPTINDKFIYLIQGQKLQEILQWQPQYKFQIIPDFGKYTAVAEIYHNIDQAEVSRSETSFYVIPVWHILVIIAPILVIALVLVIVREIRRRRA